MLTTEGQVRFRPALEILTQYLDHVPLAHALFRAAELSALTGYALPRPLLDLGCGAGQVAALALDGSLDVGIDLSEGQLRQARRTGRYGRLIHGDARELPFPAEEFQSVLAVSSLEHMADPNHVAAEAFRVLRLGGCFLATVVLADLHDHLCFPRWFRRLGLPALARWYVRCHDYLFQHQTLLSQAEWTTLLQRVGFEVVVSEKVVGPAVTRWWDFLLLTAWPYRLGQRWGWSFVWRPRWLGDFIRARCRPLLERAELEGSVMVVLARKPGGPDPGIGRLPSPQRRFAVLSEG